LIVVLGLPKTGTYTIHHALSCAGIISAHGRVTGCVTLAMALQSAYLEKKRAFEHIPNHIEAIADPYLTSERGSMWPLLNPNLLRTMKGNRFILNRRDVNDWVASVNRWKDLRERMIASKLATKDNQSLIDLHTKHYQQCSDILKGEYILDIDITDPEAKQKLSDFLGVKLPWWGKKNVNG